MTRISQEPKSSDYGRLTAGSVVTRNFGLTATGIRT
jgi:hypothetical protein